MIGLDVRKDLLAALGDQWAYYVAPELTGRGPLGFVAVNRLKDPKTAATEAYSSLLCAPVHGAPQRPIPASAQALPSTVSDSREVHCRNGRDSWTAATAASAAHRSGKGPRKTPAPGRTRRTTDSRGGSEQPGPERPTHNTGNSR